VHAERNSNVSRFTEGGVLSGIMSLAEVIDAVAIAQINWTSVSNWIEPTSSE